MQGKSITYLKQAQIKHYIMHNLTLNFTKSGLKSFSKLQFEELLFWPTSSYRAICWRGCFDREIRILLRCLRLRCLRLRVPRLREPQASASHSHGG